MEEDTLKAGAASIDITPPLGTLINGEFTNRYANKIADPLFARCLILESNGVTIVFIVVDICAMQQDFLNDVKSLIMAETGILPSNVLISSTHTHSAGSVTDLLMGHVDYAYRQQLPALIVKSVVQALQVIKPAKLGFGSIDVPEHVLCRRYFMKDEYESFNPVTGGIDGLKTNPFGAEEYIQGLASTVDPEVGYLAVKGVDGTWISLLANYSLHYVGDCERGTISADYFGHFCSAIRHLLDAGADFVGIMSNGTSGEANIWDFLHPNRYPSGYHDKSALIGREIARAVYDSLEQVIWETRPQLGVAYEYITLQSRKPSPSELRTALAICEATDFEQLELNKEGYISVYAREQVLLNAYPDVVQFPIQAFKIGRGAIGGLGGEFFAETGLALKQIKKKGAYFTICLANDYVGYVPPAHELKKGGYETWRCRTSRLAANAEELISARLIEIMNQP